LLTSGIDFWFKIGKHDPVIVPRNVPAGRLGIFLSGGPIVPRSFSNGNAGPTHGQSMSNGPQASPATITITGTHLGAGDSHWAKLV
jgi:hypothetical protein